MKNKLQKTNMTRFDHRARKLGVIGALIMAATFALCVPVAASLISSNKAVTIEIQKLQNESSETPTTYTLERK